jgi:hypothetical protein
MEDVVVVLFHDHGSRYVGKMFNDDWMREAGFLWWKKSQQLAILGTKIRHRDFKFAEELVSRYWPHA